MFLKWERPEKDDFEETNQDVQEYYKVEIPIYLGK